MEDIRTEAVAAVLAVGGVFSLWIRQLVRRDDAHIERAVEREGDLLEAVKEQTTIIGKQGKRLAELTDRMDRIEEQLIECERDRAVLHSEIEQLKKAI